MVRFNYRRKHKTRNRVLRSIQRRIRMLNKKNSQSYPINLRLKINLYFYIFKLTIRIKIIECILVNIEAGQKL